MFSRRKPAPQTSFFSSFFISLFLINSGPVNAYPIFAQQGYANPREATGRIVCANCHLAQKPVEIEVPQAVLPGNIFEAVVSIPYDVSVKQVLANGKKRWAECWQCSSFT